MTAEPEKSAPAVRHSLSGPASRALTATGNTVLRCMPGPVRRRLETEAGKRFGRFVPVAIAALASSQITLAILIWLNMTAGKAALCASIVGALVSYLLSRWAWERKGRPDLLRETVPFWAISLCVGVILTLTSKFAHSEARALGLHRAEEVLFAQGLYLLANCGTFVLRFLIFHYVLFVDRGARAGGPVEPAAEAPADTGAAPDSFAMAPSANAEEPRRRR